MSEPAFTTRFPSTAEDFRRHLGIESEQAMELFHQTVSMKAVENLNDFVRSHMLEPFDTSAQIADLIDHFDNLTRAHDAVRAPRPNSSSWNRSSQASMVDDEVNDERRAPRPRTTAAGTSALLCRPDASGP